MALTDTQRRWVLSTALDAVLTVELPAYNGLSAQYLSTGPYVPAYDSSQFGVQYNDLIIGTVKVKRSASGALIGGGRSSASVSPISIVNNQTTSAWLYQDWAERPVILRWGSPQWGEINDHVVILNGIVEDLESGNELRLLVRDRLGVLDDAYPAATYTAGEAPFSPDAIKPITHGDVRRAEPVLLDQVDLDLGVSGNGGTPVNGYDNGVLLTSPPAVNEDWLDLGGGVVRLTSPPVGQITFDTRGPTWPDVQAPTIARAVCIDQGIDPSDIDDAGLSAITGGASRKVGLYLKESKSARVVLDLIAQSCGALIFQGRNGKITGRKIALNGVPVFEADEHVHAGPVQVQRATRGSNGVKLLYRTGWTMQPVAALTGVSFAERHTLAKLYESAVMGTTDANTESIETVLIDRTEAMQEASQWQAIRAVDRFYYMGTLLRGGLLLDLGDTLRVIDALTDVRGLGFLTDSSGQPIINSQLLPLTGGRDIFLTELEDEYPFGSTNYIGYA